MRIYFYLLSGAISALIGWLVSRLILDLFSWSQQINSIIVIVSMTIFLVIGTTINECLVPNARRPKLISPVIGHLLIAGSISSILIASIVGVIVQLLVPGNISKTSIFFFLSLGLSIGMAKDLTLRISPFSRYFERKILKKYTFTNILAGDFAGLLIAITFQLFGKALDNFDSLDSLISFTLLGMVYSLILSLNNSPYYQPALRAGAGFEYTGEHYYADYQDNKIESPYIDITYLQFVSNSREEIEEGLSIKLPVRGKITIGSAKKSNICIPDIPPIVAQIKLKNCQTVLFPNSKKFQFIEINGELIESASKPISLDHNYELTFYTSDKNKFYKFVFYNRFLDLSA